MIVARATATDCGVMNVGFLSHHAIKYSTQPTRPQPNEGAEVTDYRGSSPKGVWAHPYGDTPSDLLPVRSEAAS